MSDFQDTGTRNRLAEASAKTKTWKNRVRPLAREEFSQKLVSYATTAVFFLFLGVVVVPLFTSTVIPLEEGARVGGRSGGRLMDFFFLAIVSIFSINVMSNDYFMIHRDPFRSWLVFLKGLPVSPREIVLARALIMLPATLVMTTLFFVPITAFSWYLDEGFSLVHYLWFALFWLGYALFCGGINLYVELGVKGKLALALQFVSLAVIIGAAWLFGGDLVRATFELAGEYGPLFSGLALLVGGAGFALFARATERRVGSREVGA